MRLSPSRPRSRAKSLSTGRRCRAVDNVEPRARVRDVIGHVELIFRIPAADTFLGSDSTTVKDVSRNLL
jgi:hypothetical protein